MARPPFAECSRLVQPVSAEPALDLQQLLRWQIFNVFAGNSDGHAKNLALLHSPEGGVRLAPFYGLVCTPAIARITEWLLMTIYSDSSSLLAAVASPWQEDKPDVHRG